jgi:hypothetical protein
MASDLTQFGLTEMLRCSRALHRAASGAPTMEATARHISRLLYDELRTPNGDRACALVRCYKTHPFGALPADLRHFAAKVSGEDAMAESTRCLTLLASAGSEPYWNARSSSKGHQAIPLASPQMVEQAPMIAALVRDFGLELADVTNPKPENMRNSEGKSFGVFHVEHALGSAAIPAQEEFVARYAVQSVVGFGGSLASGDLFAVILFSRVRVSAASAERFRTLALDVKALYFPFTESSVFDREDSAPGSTAEIGLPA